MGRKKKTRKNETNTGEEFVDISREVSLRFYELMDKIDTLPTDKIKTRLRNFIKKDPYFLDPYLELYTIYMEEGKEKKAKEILDKAYKKALELILDEEGNWPKRLDWLWIENRHIIRTLLEKGIDFWEEGKIEEALYIFRNLLKSNPNDNIGARYYILAIKLGMTIYEMEEKFLTELGFWDGQKIEDWFDANSKKFPEEFGWWFEYWENKEKEEIEQNNKKF